MQYDKIEGVIIMYDSQITYTRIKDIAKKNNISLKTLNEMCSLSENAISSAAKSQECMKAKNLYAISSCLNCSVDYLLGKTENPNAHKETPSDRSEGEVQEIIKIFLNLNQEGRNRLMQQAEDISEIDKYKKCDDTEQDVG